MVSKNRNLIDNKVLRVKKKALKVTSTESALKIVSVNNFVLFPHASHTLAALPGLSSDDFHLAHTHGLRLGIVTRLRKHDGDEYSASFGTEAVVTSVHRRADGQMAFAVRGLRRIRLAENCLSGNGEVQPVEYVTDQVGRQSMRQLAAAKLLRSLALRLAESSGKAHDSADIAQCVDPSMLCDLIAPMLTLSPDESLKLLACSHLRQRVEKTLRFVHRELELAEVVGHIESEIDDEFDEEARKEFLGARLVAIRQELASLTGAAPEDSDDLDKALADLPLPLTVRSVIQSEIVKLQSMSSGSAEYSGSHSYLQFVKELPWKTNLSSGKTEPDAIIRQARMILDKNHFGLAKAKDKVLEFLAVMARQKGVGRGYALLLHGPPGVGKTSLARSIADALERPFCRVSLGGVKDEAEIRGHRRTYVGAMPGKIIQAIKRAGVPNPVILLDEIDKISHDSASGVDGALLELLDPELNSTFSDHYLGFPFDMSKVLFIGTANNVESLSKPLLDRFESVPLLSYTEGEKCQIAKEYLIPAMRKELGLTARDLVFRGDALSHLCRYYARETGVRQLQRDIFSIGRRAVRIFVEEGRKPQHVSSVNLDGWLGRPRFVDEPNDRDLMPGVAIGLAYTEDGGDILYVECGSLPLAGHGQTRLSMTGRTGKVMQESAQAALSFVLAQPALLPADISQGNHRLLHVHLPDGATPKDGPSAGIAIVLAMVSHFLGRSLPSGLVATGEVTLRGQVLAVGGIREKILAAHRYGKTSIMIPAANMADLVDIEPDVLKELSIHPVETLWQAIEFSGLLKNKDAQQGEAPLSNVRES